MPRNTNTTTATTIDTVTRTKNSTYLDELSIDFENGQELQLAPPTTSTTTELLSGEMIPMPVTEDLDDIEAVVQRIADDLAAVDERLARRVLKAQHWYEQRDAETPEDVRVSVVGHNEFRRQTLVLVEDTNRMALKAVPVVICFDRLQDDALDDNMLEKIHSIIEDRVVDGMCSMKKAYYQNPETYIDDEEHYPDRIRACGVEVVDSLRAADRIAYGCDGSSVDGSSGGSEQATLSSY